MKIALACAATLAIATPALASWENFGPYTQIDAASFQPDAGGFTLLVRHYDLGKGGLPAPLDSSIAHVHFDCAAHLSRQTEVTLYDANGKVIGGGAAGGAGAPMHDNPGSVPAKIEARFCPKVDVR